jgi:methyl-accepting chemotaxis protein
VNLQNLSIGRRLSLAFASVIGIFLLVGWAALHTASNLAAAEKWNDHTHAVLTTGEGMLSSMVNMDTGARGYLLAGEDRFLEPWNAGLQEFEKSWAEAKKLTSDNPSQQKRLDGMKVQNQEFRGVAESMIALRKEVTAGTKTAADLTAEFVKGHDKAAMDGFRALNADFDKMERDLLSVRAASADSERALNRNAILGGSAFALVVAVLLWLWVTGSITGPIQTSMALAESVAQGDLTMHVNIEGKDETAKLLTSLKAMQQNLAQVVGTN